MTEKDPIATIVADVEEIIEYPARPGGLVDRHRQEKARREALAHEKELANEKIEEPSYKTVKVAIISPEIFSGQTYTIAAGGVSQTPILPAMEYRYAATVMLVPITGQTPTVILTKDQGQALSGIGFILSAGVPVRVVGRAQLWAANPGAQAIQISVLAEIYDSGA